MILLQKIYKDYIFDQIVRLMSDQQRNFKVDLNDFDQYGGSDSQSQSIRKKNKRPAPKLQVYQQDDDQIYDQQEQDGQLLQNKKSAYQNHDSDQEQDPDQAQGSDSDSLEEGEIADQVGEPIYDSNNEDSSQRLRQDMRKKQEQYKRKQQQMKSITIERVLTQEEIIQQAYQKARTTNKKILILRKKNARRIEQLQKNRMLQQNYLIPNNTHFRGNVNEYPIITSDRRGRSYFHPNSSLKISKMQLDSFIKKNIAEEASANYLNQVVKFQNYAYQQRKKRKHNFQ